VDKALHNSMAKLSAEQSEHVRVKPTYLHGKGQKEVVATSTGIQPYFTHFPQFSL